MATKVEFKRVQTDAEVENIDIKDGQLIYTGTGKTYMDYGSERIATGSGGGSVDVDTEMSDTSENAVQNKVIKEYVDDQIEISDTEPTSENNKIWIDTGEVAQSHTEITNEYSTSTGKGYSANYVNSNFGNFKIQKVYDQDLTFSNFNEDITVSSVNGTVICYYLAEAWPKNSWGTAGVLVNLAINNLVPNQVTLVTNYKQTYGIKIYAIYIPS